MSSGIGKNAGSADESRTPCAAAADGGQGNNGVAAVEPHAVGLTMHQGERQLQLSRLLWVGPLAVLASIAAVLLVRVTAVAVLHPKADFAPLGWIPPIVDTAVLVTSAVLVFLLVALFAGNPSRTYQIIAVVVLLLSFWPDIAIARSHWASWPEAFALMAMHVAAWAVCVTMLTKLMAVKGP